MLYNCGFYSLSSRALFNDVWAKMVNKFNEGKRNMMDLVCIGE